MREPHVILVVLLFHLGVERLKGFGQDLFSNNLCSALSRAVNSAIDELLNAGSSEGRMIFPVMTRTTSHFHLSAPLSGLAVSRNASRVRRAAGSCL